MPPAICYSGLITRSMDKPCLIAGLFFFLYFLNSLFKPIKLVINS